MALASALPAAADVPGHQVDPARGGQPGTSITVHKYTMPEGYGRDGYQGSTNNNGTTIDNGTTVDPGTYGASPLAGITFQLYSVGATSGAGPVIDLTTSTGWQAASDLAQVFTNTSNDVAITSLTTPATTPVTTPGYPVVAVTSGVTGADGTLTFDELPLGVYLLEETASSTPGTTPSAPFLITVPLTDPNNNSNWLYSVDVYPKNSTIGSEGATKTLDDAQVAVPGAPMSWTVSVDIPHDPVISALQIKDPLDPRLVYNPTTAPTATITNCTNDPTTNIPLTVGVDFTLTPATQMVGTGIYPPAGSNYTYSPGALYTLLTFDFGTPTNATLTTLAAHDTCQLQVTFTTTVKPGANTATSGGAIPNQAIVYPNTASLGYLPAGPGQPPLDNTSPGTPKTPPATTNTVNTYWGQVTFQKTNTQGAGLNGASFHVEYTYGLVTPDSTWWPFDATTPLISDPANATPTSQTSTTVAGVAGQVTFTQLHYSDLVNGSDQRLDAGDANYITYRLVEDTAPAGYELIPAPITFTITAPTNSLGNDTTATKVIDVASNAGFTLPLTGGTGVLAIYLAGALILATGIILLVAHNRHRTYQH